MRALILRPTPFSGVRLDDLRAAYEAWVLVLLGVGVTLPVFLAPGRISAPRLGDLALAAALPLVVLQWRRMGTASRAAGPTAAFVLLVTVMIQASGIGQTLNLSDFAFWFRWLAAALVAPAVGALIVAEADRRRLFFTALLAGAACHLATYGLLSLFGRDALQAVGLASPRAAYTSIVAHVRITTVAEHPNAAMGMIGLAAPAAFAVVGGAWSRRSLDLSAAGVTVVGFLCTLSRGGMIAAGAAWLARAVVGRRWREPGSPLGLTLAVCLLAGGLAALQVTRVDIDVSRFAARFDLEQMDANLQGRVATWTRTIDFVADQPLGVGWSTADELGTFRALTVSHNGYLFMGRTVGLLAAVLALGLHLWSAARLDALTPLSVYLLTMMFSEDLAQGAGFVFLICLVAALAGRKPVAP
ncbi:O-antigen ligase family protein [Brevundimonas sp.]|uniref:O-antigen ligase family protein n=1 Tax=Brevundimonas sp. TaxID=1871086 RepID=UPI0017E548ED|nr:O-antigen ligase family protein [Brevundimonas sp.]MBA4808021.1 O-antigen ligase family protein [Brevundimonas sp.]